MSGTVQIIAGPQEGKTIEIPAGGEVTLGRSEENRITLPYDGYISTQHAGILERDGALYLVDEGSSNGSYLNGTRMVAKKTYALKDFFLLGSTAFTVLRDHKRKPAYYSEPEPLAANDWREHPVFAHLAKAAATQQTQLVDVPLLFMTLLDQHPKVVQPFLKAIEVDVTALTRRFQSHDYFQGRLAWINKFIEFQKNAYSLQDLHITPLVKRLMVQEAQSPHKDMAKFLENIVKSNAFSLLYPLLDWQRTETSWEAYFNTTVNRRLSQSELRMLNQGPEQRFWSGLESVLNQGKALLLHGRPGAGKSSVLARSFSQNGPLQLHLPQDAPRHFFDIRTFAFFYTMERLPEWVRRIGQALANPGLVCIDHSADLLDALRGQPVHRESLVQAIHQRRAHLIMAAPSANVDAMRQTIHGMEAINVERFLFGEHLQTIQHHLKQFETHIPYKLSSEVKTYLIDTFTETTAPDLQEFRFFLDFCVARLRDIPSFVLDGIDAKSKQPLELRFFEEMVSRWRQFFAPAQAESFAAIDVAASMELPDEDMVDQAPPLPDPDDFSGEYRAFAVQLEQFVRTFASEAFRFSITYSDRTRTLDQSGRLTEPEKLAELKRLIVAMLSSYQESFRTWFDRFWQELEPSQLQASAKVGNNARKLWDAYKSLAKKIDTSLAEDQFGEQAAKAFNKHWQALKRK